LVFKKTVKFSDSVIIFTVIALWYGITNFIWWHINYPTLPCYDSAAIHFLYIFDQYKSNNPLIIWIFEFLLNIFGNDNLDMITICVNYLFFLIALYFIYKIGEEADSKETGQIAMMLFALVPAVYGLSRQFGHKDFHSIPWICANIYFLIKSDYFNDRKNSVLYGITAGIGLLTKDTILIYILPPFFWITAHVIFKYKAEIKRIINIFIALAAGSLVAGWVCFKSHAIMKLVYDPFTLESPIFSLSNIRIMTFGLYEELLSLPLFLIFLAGFIYLLKKYKNENKPIFIIWIVIPWLIIFFMPHYKVTEYFAGLIPAVALISSVFISRIKRTMVKKIILIFLIIIGIIHYVNFSYFPNNLFSRIRIKIYGTEFMYYNTGTDNIMNFDVKNISAKVTKTVKKIKQICPASRYGVYVTTDAAINNKVLRVSMLLNGMPCPTGNIDQFNIEGNDEAFVIVGDLLTDNILGREITMFKNHPILVYNLNKNNENVKEYLNEYDQKIKKNIDIINKDFELISVFYFNDVIEKNNRISIFKRKQK